MKRKTVIALVLIMVMLLVGANVKAAGTVVSGLTVPSSVDGGTTFDIVITLGSTSGETMNGFSLDMVYDTSKYTVNSMEIGQTLYGSEQSNHIEAVNTIDNTAGSLSYCSILQGNSTVTLTSQATALTINCTAANVDDTFDLIFTNDQNNLNLLVSDGSGPNALLLVSDSNAEGMAVTLPSDTTVTIVGIPPSPTRVVVNGQLHYTTFYLDGTIENITIFNGETTDTGFSSIKSYTESGALVTYKIYYSSGVLDRILTYDPNSPPSARVILERKLYNESGALLEYDTYYESGSIKTKIFYDENSPQDNRIILLRESYDLNGALITMDTYYDDGTLKDKRFFTDGNLVEQRLYQENGNLTRIITYGLNGSTRVVLTRKTYASNGNLEQMDLYYSDTGTLERTLVYDPYSDPRIMLERKLYDTNLTMIQFEQYDTVTGYIDTARLYNSNGSLIEFCQYSASINGQVTRKTVYIADSDPREIDYYIDYTYHANGNVHTESKYDSDGVLIETLTYDEDGNPV